MLLCALGMQYSELWITWMVCINVVISKFITSLSSMRKCTYILHRLKLAFKYVDLFYLDKKTKF